MVARNWDPRSVDPRGRHIGGGPVASVEAAVFNFRRRSPLKWVCLWCSISGVPNIFGSDLRFEVLASQFSVLFQAVGGGSVPGGSRTRPGVDHGLSR